MVNKELRDLVRQARGERTKKKYSEESGVNVAIISRIESGDYLPGKKVLERLTSVAAKPQGGITYGDLIEAVNDNKQYKKGVAAGKAVAIGGMGIPFFTSLFPGGMGMPVLASLLAGGTATKAQDLLLKHEHSSIMKKGEKKDEEVSLDTLEGLVTEMERYRATATGIVLSQLAEQGIRCSLGKQNDTDFPINYTDVIILLEEHEIDNWILSCFTLNEKNRNMEAFIKPFAVRFIEKLLHTKPEPKKKASFVVDSDDLYEYLLALKEHNSYRGNLSVIQFDAKNVRLIREEYLAHYDLEHSDDKLLIVSKKTEPE